MALQQLPPAAPWAGTRARHGNVRVRLHGHEALAAAGSRGRRHLEPRLGELWVREDGVASTRGRSTTPASGWPSSTTASGTADGSLSEDWVRAATGADTDSGPASYHGYGYFWCTDADRPGASTPWGSTGSTSTWPPTRTRWSFASVATGGSATATGWPPYATSPTGSHRRP